jgi:hypothetical protein
MAELSQKQVLPFLSRLQRFLYFDKTTQILYRLQAGEFVETKKPKMIRRSYFAAQSMRTPVPTISLMKGLPALVSNCSIEPRLHILALLVLIYSPTYPTQLRDHSVFAS